MFERLRARLEKLLADHTPPGDPRARAAQLHAALVETKVAVGTMRDALAATERSLGLERQQLEAAERRGRLAAQVPDPETVQVAEQFVARHRERIGVLEKKLALQREELTLAERDLSQLLAEFQASRAGTPRGTTPTQEAAWRDIEAAGGTRPETDLEGEGLRRDLDRQRMDAAVDAQLEHLKRKMKEK
ncbi:MAG TPA: hypothetical protein VMG41_04215 [Gemmatimonadales bacterium]|nr:hypothetical protein [Gemmatimonadales bacterium]